MIEAHAGRTPETQLTPTCIFVMSHSTNPLIDQSFTRRISDVDEIDVSL